ncbi:MAG: hypothetical protein KDA69_05725 [Planctomycetaceae bacterium]|nr:hypothetical protein [Planctomycetaceae bacterium]MCA9043798.1 hypothetical protein [Planctomycetaceae bacterium]
MEHALLVQYLYASASVPETSPFRQKVLNVSIQEMAHFITVENLLLAIGGPDTFHIGRDLIRSGSPLNPLPMDLEPISRLSQGKYIPAEMPATFPPGHSTEQQLEADPQEWLHLASSSQGWWYSLTLSERGAYAVFVCPAHALPVRDAERTSFLMSRFATRGLPIENANGRDAGCLWAMRPLHWIRSQVLV